MNCPFCKREGVKSDWNLYDFYCPDCKRYFRKIQGTELTQAFDGGNQEF
jgi:transposase-like protein